MTERSKAVLRIAIAVAIIEVVIFFAGNNGIDVQKICEGLLGAAVTIFIGWKDNATSERNAYFEELKPIVKAYGLKMLKDVVSTYLPTDPADDEELPL